MNYGAVKDGYWFQGQNGTLMRRRSKTQGALAHALASLVADRARAGGRRGGRAGRGRRPQLPAAVPALALQLVRTAGSPSRGGSGSATALLGGVQVHCGADECFQRLRVDLLSLVDVDRAPGVAVEAGVEEAGRVLQRGALGE